MLYRLAILVAKELMSYLRDPRTRVILIGPPLMQLVIFSFAATLEVRNVDIAVLDQDTGPLSQTFMDRVSAASFVGHIVPVTDVTRLQELIDRREVLLGLRFAPDFSRSIEVGQAAVVQVLIDGRRANAGQITLSYLAVVAAQLGTELHEQRLGVRIADPVLTQHWFNPNLIYQWFIVPGLSGVLAMMIALVVTALSIAREREMGTFDQLLVSPMTPLEIIIGKTIPALIIGAVLASLMIAAAVLLFRVPFSGSFGLLFLSLLLFMLSVVGIGLMVSSVCRTQQQAILGAFMTAVPLILISGFATPVENMPWWLQYAAEANPLKHYLLIIQGSFLKAFPLQEMLANSAPMALIALVTLSVATLFVKSRLQ
ncbi:MAG: ABC transporter permease [Pseudomonadales bacterium]